MAVGVSASLSESSNASNQSALNQNFTKMFGDKNLAKNDFTKPLLIAVGGFLIYKFLIQKKGR